MKTDTIFYRLFQSFPEIFFELIEHPPTQVQNYQFASVEVKQLAFRLDGVFLPDPNQPNQPIYFTEVQFQSDAHFYGRFFAEIFLYLSCTTLKANWRGVILYPHERVESTNNEELLNSGRIQRIYLNQLRETKTSSLGLSTVQLIVTDANQAIKTATISG